MKKNPILFFDSGIGGLSTLVETQKLLPHQNFVYVADFLNSPYGKKSKKEICDIVFKNVEFYTKLYNSKIVVLACNTATAASINMLRNFYKDKIFVGIEPALKVTHGNYKNILVMCTFATKKYSNIINIYKDKSTKFYCPQLLAHKIDENFLDNEIGLRTYIKNILKRFQKKFDVCVLGCTHYSLIKNEISDALGCSVVDGNVGVAKKLKSILGDKTKSKKNLVLISTDKQKQHLLEQSYEKLKGEKICAELLDTLEKKMP